MTAAGCATKEPNFLARDAARASSTLSSFRGGPIESDRREPGLSGSPGRDGKALGPVGTDSLWPLPLGRASAGASAAVETVERVARGPAGGTIEVLVSLPVELWGAGETGAEAALAARGADGIVGLAAGQLSVKK